MKSKLKVVQIVVAIVLPINLAVGAWFYAAGQDSGIREMRKFTRVLRLIRHFYVEGTEEKIGYGNLFHGAVDGTLRNLDAYSAYFPPEVHARIAAANKGQYGGIGVELEYRNGRLTIVEVTPKGPAAAAGLKPEDQFLRINGRDATGMDPPQATAVLRGAPATTVKLCIYRPSVDHELHFAVRRELIEIATVRRGHFIEPGIAYVQLTRFDRRTSRKLSAALDRMKQKMRALIIDLRENPGGLLESACEVSGLFLPPGKLIVTTVPRRKREQRTFHAPTGPKYLKIPIVILINRRSASGAEILAGCLHDHKRATLVGEKSYGKGSVLRILELPEDRSAIYLTTALYYTPSRQVIHGQGIKPDVEVKVPRRNARKLFRQLRRLSSETAGDAIPDPQLEKAVEILKQKLKPTLPEHN